jgi:sialate O-acetylesterase
MHPALILAPFFITALAHLAGAAVSPAVVFTDHMVLQRGLPVPVWGKAAPAEEFTVSFGGQTVSTKAGKDGSWSVSLAPLEASFEPRTMTLRGPNTVELRDVLVGEVWLCSGQSNMEKNMGPRQGQKPCDNHAVEIAAANHPTLRLFQMPRNGKPAEGDTRSLRWLPCSPEVVDAVKFSATGYYYGRELKDRLKVPVGMIHSSVGGTRIELWTTAEGFASVPSLRDFAKAAKEGKSFDGASLSSLHNSMVKPLAPFALRGFLWYQGESNLMKNDFAIYTQKTQALINGWRGLWKLPEAPFYSVQLAPHTYSLRKKPEPLSPEALPLFWEAQNAAAILPHTGVSVTNDIAPDPSDIHPTNKKDVGLRLAYLALAKTYGLNDVSAQGPTYKSLTTKGKSIELALNHTGRLSARKGETLTGFSIAGSDKKFFPAEASFVDGKIHVSSPEVKSPLAVRYGWHETEPGNLTDASALPSPAFRTDTWDIIWSRPATAEDIVPKPTPAPKPKTPGTKSK